MPFGTRAYAQNEKTTKNNVNLSDGNTLVFKKFLDLCLFWPRYEKYTGLVTMLDKPQLRYAKNQAPQQQQWQMDAKRRRKFR